MSLLKWFNSISPSWRQWQIPSVFWHQYYPVKSEGSNVYLGNEVTLPWYECYKHSSYLMVFHPQISFSVLSWGFSVSIYAADLHVFLIHLHTYTVISNLQEVFICKQQLHLLLLQLNWTSTNNNSYFCHSKEKLFVQPGDDSRGLLSIYLLFNLVEHANILLDWFFPLLSNSQVSYFQRIFFVLAEFLLGII